MLELKLSDSLEVRLREMASEAGQSPNEFAVQALKSYMENREDYLEAVDALAEDKKSGSRTYSTDEVRRELGLDR